MPRAGGGNAIGRESRHPLPPGSALPLDAALHLAEQNRVRYGLRMYLMRALGLGLLYLGVLRYSPFLSAFDHRFLAETLRLGRVPGYRWLVRSAPHA